MGRRAGVPEIFFERPPAPLVKDIGLVCAKSRQAGQFSCFLAGEPGGSLFPLWRGFSSLASCRVAPEAGKSDHILLIEDDPDVLDLVRYNLNKAGFSVTVARDGLAGLKAARSAPPDLVVLDLMLPEMRGEDVCRELKNDGTTATVPIIMLTAKAQTEDRISGLELGADDYVTKPFSPRELILRIEGLLRRVRSAGSGDKLRVGPFELDRGIFEIRLDGEKLELTAIEFKLLAMMMEKRGETLPREMLLRDVWGYRSVVDSRTVDTHMRRLRSKLGAHAESIETVRGEGYVFRL
jgi:two-component system phosphate regulon response regulator PhoB